MNNFKEERFNCADSFNFIRSLSVICVFLLHVSIYTSQLEFVYDKYTWPLKTPAWSAVWILFIISGFLLEKDFSMENMNIACQEF